MKKVSEIFDKIILNILRNSYLAIIKDIGKCSIIDNKVICLVDENKIKRDSFNSWNYKIMLNGLNKNFKEDNKEVLKKLKVDKGIQYIIENINFDKRVYIDSYDSEIVFRNCSFTDGISIANVDSIIFENNVYILSNNNKENKFGISTSDIERVNTIRFINDNVYITNSDENSNNILINLDLFAKKIEIINSKISKNTSVLIDAKDFIISQSKISSDELYITAEVIESHNSVADIKEGIIAENSDTYVDKYTLEKRKLLLNKLIQLREQCDNNIFEKTKEIIADSQKEKIQKVLKK